MDVSKIGAVNSIAPQKVSFQRRHVEEERSETRSISNKEWAAIAFATTAVGVAGILIGKKFGVFGSKAAKLKKELNSNYAQKPIKKMGDAVMAELTPQTRSIVEEAEKSLNKNTYMNIVKDTKATEQRLARETGRKGHANREDDLKAVFSDPKYASR